MDRAQDGQGRAGAQRSALILREKLRILEVACELAGPQAVLEPIVSAYRAFRDGTHCSSPGHLLSLEVAPDALSVCTGGTTVELSAQIDSTAQVYQLFLDRLMGAIASHAVLHAAALASPTGGVFLLAAASGRGKTSLTLELLSRGFGFLGDDYAPLDFGRTEIAPYPRALAIVPGGRAVLPPAFAAAAATAGPLLLGKRLLHVNEVLGEGRMIREPRPLEHVVLLSADESGAVLEETWLSVGARSSHAASLDAAFAAAAGVTVAERVEAADMTYWKLAFAPGAGATAELIDVLESDRVSFVEKVWDRTPAFTGEPTVSPVSRRETAEILGRELLNRRSGGRLLATYGGRITPLFVDLAGALRRVSCHRVRVGALSETADLVERIVRG